jgi:hypothetical protein
MGKTVPALTSQEALPQPSVQAPRTRKLDSWSDWPAARRQPRLAIPREGSALPLLVPSSPLQDQEEPVAGGIDRPPSGEPLQPTPQGWVDHGDKSVQVPLPLDMREALALPRHQVVRPERHQLADPQTGVPQHSDDELVAFRGGRVLQAIDLLPGSGCPHRAPELRTLDLAIRNGGVDAVLRVPRPLHHLVDHPDVGVDPGRRERPSSSSFLQQLPLVLLDGPAISAGRAPSPLSGRTTGRRRGGEGSRKHSPPPTASALH